MTDEAGLSVSTTAPLSAPDQRGSSVQPRRPGLVTLFPCDPQQPAATWPIRAAVIMGRAQDADVQIPDPTISRRQALLEPIATGVRVTDLGSAHGSFVDGQAIGAQARNVAFGSVLRFGGVLLLVAEDITPYAEPLRRMAASFLGLQRDVIAGPELRRVWQQAAQVAALSHPVLILGESGSGKEAVARMIHAMRQNPGPFVALNVAAIPDGLFESELFGHVRGAFTGANAARAGAFVQARGGALFIDEVGDLRPDVQGKLLRTLDQLSVRPLGSDRDVAVNARVVAATSRDLRQRCADGGFRLDLYYRLSGIVIEVPPLRARRADILALAVSFLQQEGARLRFSPRAAEALLFASWRGNVRELYHAVARASVAALAGDCDEILLEHLPELEPLATPQEARLTPASIEAAIAEAMGNASLAAKKLGVSRSTLYNVLKREGVDPSSMRGERDTAPRRGGHE